MLFLLVCFALFVSWLEKEHPSVSLIMIEEQLMTFSNEYEFVMIYACFIISGIAYY